MFSEFTNNVKEWKMEDKVAKRHLTANDVADWFINQVDPTMTETITVRQVMNLVYFAQAWYMTHTGRKLFEEDIEAWALGPALPSIHKRLGRMTAASVPKVETSVVIKKQRLEILELVADEYSGFEPDELAQLATIDGGPWSKARRGLSEEESSERSIPVEDMKQYYGGQIGKI
jgi:uncharacterized phage-associated protein